MNFQKYGVILLLSTWLEFGVGFSLKDCSELESDLEKTPCLSDNSPSLTPFLVLGGLELPYFLNLHV